MGVQKKQVELESVSLEQRARDLGLETGIKIVESVDKELITVLGERADKIVNPFPTKPQIRKAEIYGYSKLSIAQILKRSTSNQKNQLGSNFNNHYSYIIFNFGTFMKTF